MVRAALVDSGPVVALLRPDDPYHDWARETLGALKPPLSTCEAVLAEASYLLRRVPGASSGVLELVVRGILEVRFRLDAEVTVVRDLMQRYRSVPMSLADACLVRMAELEPQAALITLDQDFLIYRRNARHRIAVVMPERS